MAGEQGGDMTIGELIERLSHFNPEWDVYFDNDMGPLSVREVRLSLNGQSWPVRGEVTPEDANSVTLFDW